MKITTITRILWQVFLIKKFHRLYVSPSIDGSSAKPTVNRESPRDSSPFAQATITIRPPLFHLQKISPPLGVAFSTSRLNCKSWHPRGGIQSDTGRKKTLQPRDDACPFRQVATMPHQTTTKVALSKKPIFMNYATNTQLLEIYPSAHQTPIDAILPIKSYPPEQGAESR